jgi:hypothetical protein
VAAALWLHRSIHWAALATCFSEANFNLSIILDICYSSLFLIDFTDWHLA